MSYYVEEFGDRWIETDKAQEVRSVTCVSGSMSSSYLLVEDDEGVQVETCSHPMQTNARVCVLTAPIGTKVMKINSPEGKVVGRYVIIGEG